MVCTAHRDKGPRVMASGLHQGQPSPSETESRQPSSAELREMSEAFRVSPPWPKDRDRMTTERLRIRDAELGLWVTWKGPRSSAVSYFCASVSAIPATWNPFLLSSPGWLPLSVNLCHMSPPSNPLSFFFLWAPGKRQWKTSPFPLLTAASYNCPPRALHLADTYWGFSFLCLLSSMCFWQKTCL